MFSLTKSEQWLLAFLIGGLLVGTAVRHYRQTHATPLASGGIEQKAR